MKIIRNGKEYAAFYGAAGKATPDSAGIVQPDGETITVDERGIISAKSSGDVTSGGDNTFTGSNTFMKETTFGSNLSMKGALDSENIVVGANNDLLSFRQESETSGVIISPKDKTVVKGDMYGNVYNHFLAQDTVEQGYNILITKTEKGIKIETTGVAEINDETPSSVTTYSSDKIESIIGSIDSILDLINGEVIE